MYDLIVVGCGIIGATTVQGARSLGMSVLALDSNEDGRATPASGGHIRLAWLRKCREQIVKDSMAALDKIWGLDELQFRLDNDLTDSVFRVDTDLVTSIQKTTGKVIALNDLRGCPKVTFITDGGFRNVATTKLLLVSAGVWCRDLLDLPKIQSKAGVSFRVDGRLSEPFIKTWAPYKQIVAHQQAENEIWIGDGSAILSKNWTEERTAECRQRCLAELVEQPTMVKAIHGWRPYCDHDEDVPCLFQKIGPNAYVATGSKKDGTIASGWVAHELLGI